MRVDALGAPAGFLGLRRLLHRHLAPEGWPEPGLSRLNKVICAAIIASTMLAILETEPAFLALASETTFFVVDLAFALLFALEYAARVFAAGEDARYQGVLGRLLYMATPLALIDLLAVAPFFLFYGATDTFLLRIIRLLRLLRLARLGGFSLAFQHLTTAVRSRRFELGLSVLIAGIILIFSSTLMHVFESSAQPEVFGSIPRALWWSIATLTTVGYGDVYPVTPLGKLLAGLTAISAIGLIAMPTGILAAAFSDAFQRHREQLDNQGNDLAKDFGGVARMAFRFRRSVRLAPGVRLNFSKSGVSLSAGPRGASMTFSGRGTYSNLGLPGTGVSFRSRVGTSGAESRSLANASRDPSGDTATLQIVLSLRDDGAVEFVTGDREPLPPKLVRLAREQLVPLSRTGLRRRLQPSTDRPPLRSIDLRHRRWEATRLPCLPLRTSAPPSLRLRGWASGPICGGRDAGALRRGTWRN